MKRVALLLALSCVLAAGCGSNGDESDRSAESPPSDSANGQSSLPQGSEPVTLDPADFTTRVDNPYWPMPPGRKWVYEAADERIEVTVTDKKKTVEGVKAVVLRDVVTTKDGDLVEVTDDWYAQDSDGNVWYLGEDTKEYENGKVVTTSGSWESGVDGAEAGVIMAAKPRPGVTYRQEYYEGEAEDAAEVLSLEEGVTVPFGSFRNVLKTEDTTPLEPDVVEHKFYARGVGPVLRTSAGGGGREELVSFRR